MHSPDDVAANIRLYRDAVEAQGRVFDPMSVAVTRAFFVADSEAEREAALGDPLWDSSTGPYLSR